MRLAIALLAALAVGLSVLPRLLLATGALPEPLRPFVWSDPLFVYERGLTGHRVPYADTPFEYPPVIGLLSALFSLLASNGASFVALWGAVQILSAGLAAWLLAGAGDPSTVRWRFALAPQLLLLGALNFDLVAVAFLALALANARGGRDGRVVGALALGTATKLFPLAAAPVAVLRASRPARAAGIGIAVLGAAYLPAIIAGRSAGTSPLYYLAGIEANIDSPWGLVTRLGGALGITEARVVVTAVTLIGLAVTYALAVLPRSRGADPVATFGLAVVATLLWSRLYSPQYSLWLLPFFALLPLGGRLFALLVSGDLLVFLSISPLTLVPWSGDDPRAVALLGALVVGVSLRLVAIVGIWRSMRRLTAPAIAR